MQENDKVLAQLGVLDEEVIRKGTAAGRLVSQQHPGRKEVRIAQAGLAEDIHK